MPLVRTATQYLILGLLVLLCCNVATSTLILAYTDSQCTDNSQPLNTFNGYPNGTCASLRSNSSTGSFQVIQQDPGCRVLIYGDNFISNEPCSGTMMQYTDLDKCYATSSWAYYSIELCSAPSANTSTSDLFSLSVSPSARASKSPPVSNGSSIAAPVPPSARASNPPSAANNDNSHVGAIIGGIVGAGIGVVFLVGLFRFIICSLKKRLTLLQKMTSGDKLQTTQELAVPLPRNELPVSLARNELPVPLPRIELP